MVSLGIECWKISNIVDLQLRLFRIKKNVIILV